MSESRERTPTPHGSWEDAPAFRELFLLHLPPLAVDSFREAGRHLYDGLLEGDLPDPGEPWMRARVRALARDLRFTAQVLASLGAERIEAHLTPEETGLAMKAESWARELSEFAQAVEGSLGVGRESP